MPMQLSCVRSLILDCILIWFPFSCFFQAGASSDNEVLPCLTSNLHPYIWDQIQDILLPQSLDTLAWCHYIIIQYVCYFIILCTQSSSSRLSVYLQLHLITHAPALSIDFSLSLKLEDMFLLINSFSIFMNSPVLFDSFTLQLCLHHKANRGWYPFGVNFKLV